MIIPTDRSTFKVSRAAGNRYHNNAAKRLNEIFIEISEFDTFEKRGIATRMLQTDYGTLVLTQLAEPATVYEHSQNRASHQRSRSTVVVATNPHSSQ